MIRKTQTPTETETEAIFYRSLTHLTMWGRGRTRTLYKDPPLDRQTNITENITFVTPLAGSIYFVDKFRNLTLQKLPDISLDVRLN